MSYPNITNMSGISGIKGFIVTTNNIANQLPALFFMFITWIVLYNVSVKFTRSDKTATVVSTLIVFIAAMFMAIGDLISGWWLIIPGIALGLTAFIK